MSLSSGNLLCSTRGRVSGDSHMRGRPRSNTDQPAEIENPTSTISTRWNRYRIRVYSIGGFFWDEIISNTNGEGIITSITNSSHHMIHKYLSSLHIITSSHHQFRKWKMKSFRRRLLIYIRMWFFEVKTPWKSATYIVITSMDPMWWCDEPIDFIERLQVYNRQGHHRYIITSAEEPLKTGLSACLVDERLALRTGRSSAGSTF